MKMRVGIDHVEVSRIARAMRTPRFLPRYFGREEIAHFESKGFAPTGVAANFCAKEAFAKALGTGVRGFSLREVQTLREGSGRPYFVFSGGALALVEQSGLTFEVSLSHDKRYALAQVIGYSTKEGGQCG